MQSLVNKMLKLGDRLHLNRQMAVSQLENELLPQISSLNSSAQGGAGSSESPYEAQARQIMIDVTKLMFNSSRWEDKFGAINACVLLIRFFYPERVEGQDFEVQSAASNSMRPVDPQLTDFIWNHMRINVIPKLLVDDEFRVRNEIGPLLREMILKDRNKGFQHFQKLIDSLLDNIEFTFTREPEGGVDASADVSKLKARVAAAEEGSK